MYEEHKELTKKYSLHRKLGEGSYGVVMECVRKSTGLKFAVKIVKKIFDPRYSEDCRKEAKICSKLNHPNVVRLHESIESRNAFYLIFDLVVGGELHEEIARRKMYTEVDASHCMEQILEAIHFCHSQGVVHFDLKPGNILLTSNDRGAVVKIADFGLSFVIVGDERINLGYSGTYIFMPPEVIGQKLYGKPVDIWSCGVIMYTLLVGDYPIYDDDDNRLLAKLQIGAYDYPPYISNKISPLAKDLIKHMMKKDSYKRLTSAEALRHSWISNRESSVPRNNLPETVAQMKKFNARRKFKAGIFAAMALGKFAKAIPSNIFKKNSLTGSINIPKVTDSKTGRGRHNHQQEIITLTEQFVAACKTGHSKTIAKLCAPNVTAFQKEGSGKLIKGVDFQRLCLQHNSNQDFFEVQTSILDPYVHLLDENAACIAYIRLTRYISHHGYEQLLQREETCVWQKTDGKWKNVHFHSGRSKRKF